MTDSVATEMRISNDRLNATAVFFGSFQWTSCKAAGAGSELLHTLPVFRETHANTYDLPQ